MCIHIKTLMRPPSVGEFELHLPCDAIEGCGITIVGSRSTGIAIRSLLPGGSAERDGRLQVGDKLITVDGRRAILMTCAQVARCLRQDRVVALRVDRPDYDLVESQIYYGNRVKTNGFMSTSSSYSTTSSEQDCEPTFDCGASASTQRSPDLISSVTEIEYLTPSPADLSLMGSSTDLLYSRQYDNRQYDSRQYESRQCDNKQYDNRQYDTNLAVPYSTAMSLKFCYPTMDKIKKIINILPRGIDNESGDTEDIDMKVYSDTRYKSFHDTQSMSSSVDTESGIDMQSHVFRGSIDSSERLICSSPHL